MTTAIRNVRLLDDAHLGEPTTVVVDGDRIAGSAAAPTDEVDGHGGVLLPGLVDAHVHLVGDDDIDALARAGVTTALDMACWPPARVEGFRGRVCDVRSAGIPAIGPGGNHARMPGMPADAVIERPDQAEGFADRRLADGSDYLKIVIERGALFDAPTVDALAAAARARGLRSVAHASSADAFRMAVRAGVDVVTHVPRDAPLDEETVSRMAAAGQVAVPTLVMMEAVVTQFAAPGDAYAHSRDSVAALHAAGVPILAGTDAMAAPMLPRPLLPGASLPRELSLLVDAGLSAAEALRAATSGVAAFGLADLADRGVVAPGRRADLVLLDEDPLADIGATARVRHVWSAGRQVR